MTKIHTRLSILPDVSRLQAALRKPDLDEITAQEYRPRTALMFGYLHGECYTALAGSKVLCMYGVVPEPEGGRIWMLSCDGIEKYGLGVSRITRGEIKRFLSQYRYIYNIVDERNQVTIRWLKWLGFKFGSTHLIGPSRQPFKEFTQWIHS